jgi:HK97 gp10 family phage protein
MADETVKVTGLKEIKEKLSKLPEKIQKNILRTAIHAAAAELRDAAKEEAPVRSGELRKSIKAVRKRGTKVEVQSNVNVGAFYGLMVEKGHVLAKRNNAGKVEGIGHVPAHPFLRPAYDRMKDKVVDFVKNKIAERLFKLAKS